MVEVMKAISALVTACTAESMKSTLKNISVPQKLKGYSHLICSKTVTFSGVLPNCDCLLGLD